jgi:hypothetical protein
MVITSQSKALERRKAVDDRLEDRRRLMREATRGSFIFMSLRMIFIEPSSLRDSRGEMMMMTLTTGEPGIPRGLGREVGGGKG